MRKLIYFLPLLFCLIQAAKAQTATADNRVQESITFRDIPTGPGVNGIFEGRTPSPAVARRLGADLPAGLDHLKWQLVLFRDSLSGGPTTYSLHTELFGGKPLTGTWIISGGTPADPTSAVLVLNEVQPGKPLYLLKGDENVLFILDESRSFQTGDKEYSYTLNRVKKVRRLSN